MSRGTGVKKRDRRLAGDSDAKPARDDGRVGRLHGPNVEPPAVSETRSSHASECPPVSSSKQPTKRGDVRRTRFDDWDCSIARTVDMLGDWWTPLVVRTAFLGARRFDEFQAALGIPRNVLTERLRTLVDAGRPRAPASTRSARPATSTA